MAKKIKVPEGDEDDERKGKVSWLPVILLLMMVGPACVPLVEYGMTLVYGTPKPPTVREKLEAFYKEHDEYDKLADKKGMDRILRNYMGQEKKLFANLAKKYPPKPFSMLRLQQSAADFVSNAMHEPKDMILLGLMIVLGLTSVYCVATRCTSSLSKPKRRRRSDKKKEKEEKAEKEDEKEAVEEHDAQKEE
mmetsp:Transcript_3075/g.5212  ORF Transcript_3075/g.5212 Transcript_3075/m.5212 type:complete len:192 (+) Transcript_3075:110-685(+)